MSQPASLPYGRHCIEDDDIAAVVAVLKSDWLTTGPQVEAFERAFAAFTGSAHAVAVSNGTAALHAAIFALGIQPGDEVIVPANSFAASANCIVYQGGRPVFADVEDDTLLLDSRAVERLITPRTRAVVAVDYAGHPCDYDALRALADRHQLRLIADACHAVGGHYRGRPVGSLADLSTFSFHPVKSMTTGEGGMVTTQDPELARRMRLFRSHGVSVDFRQRMESGTWFYEMQELGYNYRLSDLQCALGITQLRKLPRWVERCQAIAARYDAALAGEPRVRRLACRPDVSHGYHLYVIRVPRRPGAPDRAAVFAALRGQGIGVNVHYVPIHLHPYYRRTFGTGPGLCPVAEQAYEELISLPMFPGLSDADVDRVLAALHQALG